MSTPIMALVTVPPALLRNYWKSRRADITGHMTIICSGRSPPKNGGGPVGVHHPDLSQSRTLDDPTRRRSSVAVPP